MKTILLTLLVSFTLFAQPGDVSLFGPVPVAPNVSAVVVGNPGIQPYDYYVIVNYGGGAVVSAPAYVSNAPNALSASAYVNIGWRPLQAAVTYDVVRVAHLVPFTGSCTCAIATGLTVVSTKDTGSALASYTMGTPAVAVNGTIYANNRDYMPPELRQILNGVDLPIGGGAGGCNTSATSATQILYSKDNNCAGDNYLKWLYTTHTLQTTGSASTDLPATSANLITNGTTWTSTGWTGDATTGWTHTNGNTNVLSTTNITPNTCTGSITPYSSFPNCLYSVTWTLSGYVSGTFTVSFGGVTLASATSATGASGPIANTATGLSVTPSSDFVGTLALEVYNLTSESVPVDILKSSNGQVRSETRASQTARNTLVGAGAGVAITTGADNTAFGNGALTLNTSGIWNTVMGVDALSNNATSSTNVAIGVDALHSLISGLGGNTAIGTTALQSLSTGYQNTAIGNGAGATMTTGQNNVAVGQASMLNDTTGFQNTAVGSAAMQSNTSGVYNVAVGNSALASNTSAGGNTAVGTGALQFGTAAGNSNNVAMGFAAGAYRADGVTQNLVSSLSTFLGFQAYPLGNSENNEIVIGANAVGHGTGTTTIGSAATVRSFILGITNILQGTPASSSASCTSGDVEFDASFIYVCVAANTWKRVGVSTW